MLALAQQRAPRLVHRNQKAGHLAFLAIVGRILRTLLKLLRTAIDHCQINHAYTLSH